MPIKLVSAKHAFAITAGKKTDLKDRSGEEGPLFNLMGPEADCRQTLRVSDAARRQKVFGARTAVVMGRAMGKAVLCGPRCG